MTADPAAGRPRLILASASPARRSTLRAAGVHPQVVVSGVDEDALVAARTAQTGGLPAAELCLMLARAKCEDVARRPFAEGALVLGCDSVLEFAGRVFGKPADEAAATARWQAMRGRHGVLHSGHWLIDNRHGTTATTTAGHAAGDVASVRVWFADVDDAEIAAYVATGEPLRVAGAFTIDGLGGPFIERVDGDPHAVVGLSLPLLRRLLRDRGVAWQEMARWPQG